MISSAYKDSTSSLLPPTPPSSPQPMEKKLNYGTSGYRARWTLLSPVVVFRTAYYAAQRARKLGKAIGLMITASHNPPEDNGVKIVDWNGQMLPIECESHLDAMINMSDASFREKCIQYLDTDTMGSQSGEGARVIIGTDTRQSSPALLEEAMRGCRLVNLPVDIHENHTTPQIHFIIRAINDTGFANPADYIRYFQTAFADSFNVLALDAKNSNYENKVYLDCANGVGALWVKKYVEGCAGLDPPLRLHLINTDVQAFESLNLKCGADHVKITKTPPTGFYEVPAGAKCASLDGDADRLVYFYAVPSGSGGEGFIRLLDGDHICVLFAKFIKDQFNAAKDSTERLPLTFGVVQTAYSNGSSTRYLRQELMIDPLIVKTGVKHLDKAARMYDVGVYFEGNGHGTVTFSDKFHEYIRDCKKKVGSPTGGVPRHVLFLELFSRLVNEIVGDGIADFLAVETLLRYYGWSISDWEEKTYQDLPSVQLKVKVKDRGIYESHEDNESLLVRPQEIQDELNSIVSEYSHARAFIRPSGTEEIVRIYVEARSQADADEIAKRMEELIVKYSSH